MPEFTTRALRGWLNRLGVKILAIELGSSWENGCIEPFNGKMKGKLLNREVFTALTGTKVLIDQWKGEYNQVRSHSLLGCRPSAPEARVLVTPT